MRQSARMQRRKGGYQLGPEADEEGLGFKVPPMLVFTASLVFAATVVVAHMTTKLLF